MLTFHGGGYDHYTLRRLAAQVDDLREQGLLDENARYVFDKLLHNDYRLVPEKLGTVDIRLLVSLREPEPAIQSIADLFAGKQTGERYASPAEASGYYIARLEWIAGFCRSTGLPYDYYDAELFRAAPDRLLGSTGSLRSFARSDSGACAHIGPAVGRELGGGGISAARREFGIHPFHSRDITRRVAVHGHCLHVL